MTNNPGAAGGALTDLQGNLVGILGKELRSKNNVWLGLAIPTGELLSRRWALPIRNGKNPANTKEAKPKKPDNPLTLDRLGLVTDSERARPHAAVCRCRANRLGRGFNRRPARRFDSAREFASRAVVCRGEEIEAQLEADVAVQLDADAATI